MNPDLIRAMPVSAEARGTSEEIAAAVIVRAAPLSVLATDDPTGERETFYSGLTPIALSELNDWELPAAERIRYVVKDETRHKGGAFKLRGATRNLQLQLATDPTIQEVHTASTGNRGRGVSIAARQHGLQVVVHVPKGISPVKRQGLLDTGATVDETADTFEAARAATEGLKGRPGIAVIEPYDDVCTMAGQASCGYEVVADLLQAHDRGEVDLHRDEITVWMPGGGGFGAGCAIALEDLRRQGIIGPNVMVKIAQMENYDALGRQYRSEEPLTMETLDPTCDAGALLEGGTLTQAIIVDPCFVADVVTMPKLYVAQAMDILKRKHGYAVEPAAALGLAAAMWYEKTNPRKEHEPSRMHITITSGANVADATERHFAAVLQAEWRRQFMEASNTYLRRKVHGPEEALARSALRGVSRRILRVADGLNVRS